MLNLKIWDYFILRKGGIIKTQTTVTIFTHVARRRKRRRLITNRSVTNRHWLRKALKTVKTLQIHIPKQEKQFDLLPKWLIETKTGSFIWDPSLPPPETLISPPTPPPIPIFSHPSVLSTTNPHTSV